MLKKYLMILIVASVVSSLNDVLKDKWDNKLIKHHQVLIKDMEPEKKPKDCWICTHSPVSAATMPYLAAPLTETELFNVKCEDDVFHFNDPRWGEIANVSVPLPIAGWVTSPWWQMNMTAVSGRTQILVHDGIGWVPRDVVGTLDLRKIPEDRIQISFDRSLESRYVANAFNPLYVERYIHNVSWPYASLFPSGNEESCKIQVHNMECDESVPYTPKTTVCGNPHAGYCSPLGSADRWCILANVTKLVDYAHRGVLGHSNLWQLPRDLFWVCGGNAYKWIPTGSSGTCTLARLTPATFIISHSTVELEMFAKTKQGPPRHVINKRAKDNQLRRGGRPHLVSMSAGDKIGSTIFLWPMVMQTWDKLVESTDYLDEQIYDILDLLNETNTIQGQLIVVTNQHTIVLDYLTAVQGGMCQVIGPTCCHYIDPEGNLQVHAGVRKIQEMREKWEKEHAKKQDSWWSDTLTFLNPANWFKGVKGWIVGILHFMFQAVLICLSLYALYKLIVYCVRKGARESGGTYGTYVDMAPTEEVYDQLNLTQHMRETRML